MSKSSRRCADGRFSVSIPFNPEAKPLCDSFKLAQRRYLSLERRLEKQIALKDRYSKFINEFIDLDHLLIVPVDEIEKPDNEMFYLPHHCIEKEASSTTKLRVVFDASAVTTSGISLNDVLLTCPRLQDDLFELLLPFRFHRIGLTADVEKMYRKIALNAPDKDFHRILWRERKSESLKTYRVTRVTYGVLSSAHQSIRTLQEAARVEYDSQMTAVVLREFAVDDLLTGASSLDDAV